MLTHLQATFTVCVPTNSVSNSGSPSSNNIPMTSCMLPCSSSRVARDDEGGRELAALELVGGRLDAVEYVVDERGVVALGDDLFGRSLALEVELEDWVEHVVGRKTLVVELVGGEFRRGALVDDGPRDQLAFAIDVARERIDLGLENVADDGESDVRVAVERAVAEGEFRLVAGRKQQTALGVRDGHQDVAAQARLQVLRRQTVAAARRLSQS